ncbi:MAG: twin-arginine translocation signal domain-containing protein, partial [Stellaceae bacterium]
MKRREFLKAGAAVSASALLPRAALAVPFPAFIPEPGKWRSYEIVTRVELQEATGAARAWVPLPSIAASDWIKPLGDDWKIDGGKAVERRVGPYDARMLAAEWAAGVVPVVEVTSRVATADRAIDLAKPGKAAPLPTETRALNLAATQFIPTGGIVKATSDKIVAGATGDVD